MKSLHLLKLCVRLETGMLSVGYSLLGCKNNSPAAKLQLLVSEELPIREADEGNKLYETVRLGTPTVPKRAGREVRNIGQGA